MSREEKETVYIALGLLLAILPTVVGVGLFIFTENIKFIAICLLSLLIAPFIGVWFTTFHV